MHLPYLESGRVYISLNEKLRMPIVGQAPNLGIADSLRTGTGAAWPAICRPRICRPRGTKSISSIWASPRPAMPTACCKTSIGRPDWSATFRPIRWAISTPRSSSPPPMPNWGAWGRSSPPASSPSSPLARRKDPRRKVSGLRLPNCRVRYRQAVVAPAADRSLASQARSALRSVRDVRMPPAAPPTGSGLPPPTDRTQIQRGGNENLAGVSASPGV